MKLTRKLTLALVAGILAVHGLSAALWIVREMDIFEADATRDEEVLGRAIGVAVERIHAAEGSDAAVRYVEEVDRRESHVRVRWVWLRDAEPDHAPRVDPSLLAPLSRGEPLVVNLPGHTDPVYTYVPIELPDSRPAAIEIGDSQGEEQRYLTETVTAAIATAGILVILSALIAWALGVAMVGRPVRALVEHAKRVGAGDLTTRLPVRSRDELGELAKSFNQMSDGLEAARDATLVENKARISALEQLRHADRLATVGTLASGVAHELGTPLNVVDGHAQLIREASSGAVAESAETIRRQCQRMTQIIQNLLRFARRSGEESHETTDVSEVVRETVRMLEPFAKKRGVAPVVELDDDASARISFGPIQQVLANLVVNAVQAMPGGGELRLRVHDEARDGAKFVRLDVEDGGTGMDEATRSRVFEPFFTTKDVGDGTGLGLSVAYGIVRDHGGFIDVRSEPGRGSVFSVFLPKDEPKRDPTRELTRGAEGRP
jgi:signal transduction histidine kinase